MEANNEAALAAEANSRADDAAVVRSKRRPPTHEELLASALDFAGRGWCCFPLAPGQKIPPKGSKGSLDATAERKRILAWWDYMPHSNIAIGTGKRSGFFALDVDPRHGGSEVIKALQKEHGRLPNTVTVHTGGGGFQFYYKYAEGIRNSANKIGVPYATQFDDRGKAITGIDIRGDGGYVAAPPSLHPSGGVYYFHSGMDPDSCEIAEAPAWLIKAALAGNDVATTGKPVARPDLHRSLFKYGAGAGERNETATKIAGYLFRSNIDPIMARDILDMWNDARVNPPLSAKELDTICESIAGKELKRIMMRRMHG